MIARIAPIAGPLQGTQFDQFRQIARSRRRGGIGDRAIVVCAEAPDEPVRPFGHHADQRLLLPRVDPAAQAIEQARLLDQEPDARDRPRSEEHTSELQSLMRISYAVFCLKKKKNTITINTLQST